MGIIASSVGTANQDIAASPSEILSVGSGAAVSLTVPSNANSALISVEADATVADSTRVVRFLETGATPTASVGMALGNNDTYEVRTSDNLRNFKVIGIEAGKTQSLKINYYQ